YKMKNDVDFSRIFDGEKLIGVLNFNNMIPVDDGVIRLLDVKIKKNDMDAEKAYKILCAKELDWVQKNQDAIVKKQTNFISLFS
ncbi:MAG: type III toxin-antitoxin system ToxN/AbiQ family toxin, partial [Lachnospiraceae bacterium]|nr:type III toxin-antitoxin system ToxN/AbiQ family toxin [Lachnospiraceae bacterium]